MIAFKGFTHRLTSVLGNDVKEKCTFTPGETKTETASKTGESGYHCCENPFDCLTYYPLDGSNRLFKVEAAGDIDEDTWGRITCTELTLIEELTPLALAFYGMMYMVNHPARSGWEKRSKNVLIKKDEAEAAAAGQIAIARGRAPKVRGPEDSILGLLVEGEDGEIKACKLMLARSNQWYRLNADGKVEVAV